ncbi:MAG TPA: PAS domain S-box protein [Candidatus Angelobacter sp.]
MVSFGTAGTKRAMQAAGVLISGLAVAVLIGWHFHSLRLIQVLPNLAPMQRMTALGFLLSGIALLFAAAGRRRAVAVCAWIVLALSAAVCLEYALNADFGIDQLLGPGYVTTHTSHPGRMSPVAALCFVVGSVALLVTASRRLARFASGIVGILSSMLVAVGTVSILGYLLGHSETYGWGHFTRMALHTSGAFALLGAGLLAWAWQERRVQQGAPEWLPWSLGMGLAAGALGIWQALTIHEESKLPLISGIILAGGILGALLVAFAVAQAQKAHKRSREVQAGSAMMQELFDVAPDGLVMVDRQGTILRVNDHAAAIFGYARNELLGASIEELVPLTLGDLQQRHRADYHASPSARPMGQALELKARRKDGSEFPGEITLTPLQTPGSEPVVVAVVRDISERRKAQEALRQSEERFRKIFEEGPIGLALITTDYRIAKINTALSRMMGYSEAELKEKSFRELTHPDDPHVDAVLGAPLFEGKVPYLKLQKRYIKKDGAILWANVTASAIRDSEGKPLYGVAMIEDITERKRAEAELQLGSEIFAHMEEAVCLIRVKDGIIVHANPKFEKMFGYGPGELTGKQVEGINAGARRHPEEVSAEIRAEILRSGVWRGEIQHKRKDGTTFWCAVTGSIFHHPEFGEVGISIHQDITELKKAQETLRQSEERFRSIFEQGPIGLSLMGRDGRFIKANSTMCTMLGYSEEELTRMTPLEITHREDRDATVGLMKRVFEQDFTIRRLEKRYVKKNRETIWAHLSVTVIRDQEGSPLYGVGMIEDITERRRAEAELRLGSEIFANMEEAVCLVRMEDGVIVHANPKFEKMFGYSPNELAGKRVELLNAEAARRPKEVAEEINAEVKRSSMWRGEVFQRRKDGTPFWCAVTVSAFHHPEFGRVGIAIHQDITELKTAQETLRASEERFRGVFEQGPIGVALLDAEHRMVKTNPAFTRMLGYSEAELAKMTPLDMTHPDDRPYCIRLLTRLDTGEIPVCKMEKRYLKKNGEIMWASLTASVVRDSQGRPVHGLGLVEDITERKQAEQKLAEQAALLNLAHDAIAVRDQEGRIIFWNRGARETYGWSAEEAIGRSPVDLLKSKYPIPLKEIEAIVMSQGAWEGELEQVTREGKPIVVASRWSLWRDEQGAPKAFLVINRDITERKRNEEQLRSLMERLSLATRTASIGIWDWDLHTNMVVWDDTLFEIFRIPKVVPMHYQDFSKRVHPEDLARVQASLQRAIDGKTQTFVEFRILRPDGAIRHISAAQGAVTDEHGAVVRVVGTGVDISERRHMEAQIESNKAQLITSARLSALGMMAGNIAHEINNPVGIIHALASNLIEMVEQEEAAPPDLVARNGRRIRETAERIAGIVKSLLQIAREGSSDRFFPTRIGKILDETLEICRARFRSNGVKLLLPAEVPELSVSCREVQIAQVLLNLLQNAFDAVVDQAGERWVRVDVTSHDDSVEIAVTDSGPGIPPELRPRIMEPFFTTKPVGKGTGLGLSLSKTIAEEHGGKLEFGEDHGRTRFSLSLPLVKQAEVVWN